MFISIRARMEDREEGFTLIELLVVVIIIGILAAIAIPTFLRQRERGWEASAQSDIRNASVALESIAVETNGSYVSANGASNATPGALDTEGYNASPSVTLSVCGGTAGYVIDANHASGGDFFRFSSTTGQMARQATAFAAATC